MSKKKTVQPRLSRNANEGSRISVRGARQHNLKNIDVEIPHGKLVVVTGPSGSGKSSLAISTIFAEGRRQYIETLSTYARQFVSQLPRPDVDSVEGLQATLCIDQHPSNNSPRSTVGTVTEISDYLRVMMARAAVIQCHKCAAPIRQLAIEKIIDWIEQLPPGTKAIILAPMVRGRRGKHADILEQVRKAGLLRARIDGQLLEIDSLHELNPRKNHSIEAVTDRIIVRPGNTQRITESVNLAINLSNGICTIHYLVAEDDQGPQRWRDELFSTRYACPNCDVSYAELEPKNFSFNSPYGACQACEGLGWLDQFDPDAFIPDKRKSIADGGIAVWRNLAKRNRLNRIDQLEPFFKLTNLTPADSIERFSERQFDLFLNGSESGKSGERWIGLNNILEQEFATCTSETRMEFLESFRGEVICQVCDGSRLGSQARSASVAGKSIIDLGRAPLGNLLEFFESLEFDHEKREIGQPIANEISHRLRYLCDVGLDYLTLERPADTLSGGEYQRVRLATSIGSGLANVCYVLDEPTIGLHPRDNRRLIESIQRLKDKGNSIIVVEHDKDMMQQADWLIDFGPGAGTNGGQIVFQGSYQQILDLQDNVTGDFLAGRQRIQRRSERRSISARHQIRIRGASAHNLQNIDVDIPMGVLVCITGVSGSGKSTLIQDTLAPAVARKLGFVAPRPGAHKKLEIKGPLNYILQVDQRPIGQSSRSNAATYTGAMKELRKLFASTKLARAKGFGPSRFSFNSKQGWCPACQGHGQTKIEMNFLPDLYTTCDQCRGKRFNRQTLQVKYRDYSIADMLDLSIEEMCDLLKDVPGVFLPLSALSNVGLGYLPLGQSSTTLSGGEAQRVKLAAELCKKQQADGLYLFDEPTTGLHFADVQRLMDVLHQLVNRGNSVIVIEHHTDFIAGADWIIELGPGGGQQGGQLVSAGPP